MCLDYSVRRPLLRLTGRETQFVSCGVFYNPSLQPLRKWNTAFKQQLRFYQSVWGTWGPSTLTSPHVFLPRSASWHLLPLLLAMLPCGHSADSHCSAESPNSLALMTRRGPDLAWMCSRCHCLAPHRRSAGGFPLLQANLRGPTLCISPTLTWLPPRLCPQSCSGELH